MEPLEWQRQDPALVRIAKHLETLPVELVEPILEDIPFFRVLDLWISYPVFRELIRNHPNWVNLFGDKTEEIEYLWTSLNQLAWIQCRGSWTQQNAHRLTVDSDGLTHLISCAFLVPYYLHRYTSMLPKPNARVLLCIRNNWIHWDRQTPKITGDHFVTYLKWEWRSSLYNLLGLRNFRGACIAGPELQALLHYMPPDSALAKMRADMVPEGEDLPDEFAEELSRRLDGSEWRLSIDKDLVGPQHAYTRFFQEQSAELNALADLYERFPRFLKVVGAPEQPTSESHVLARLRYDANRQRKIPHKSLFNEMEHNVKSRRNSHRFRYPHPSLVPFEWCLRLFKHVVKRPEVEKKLPQHLRVHFDRALEGVDFIYCHAPGKRLRRTIYIPKQHVAFAQYPFSNAVIPKPRAEIDWLESFVTVTEWMTKEYPDITHSVASSQLSVLRRRLLADPSDYRLFVDLEHPRVIATQLRADLAACRAGSPSELPSLLALYMPPWGSLRTSTIARYLAPHRKCSDDLLQLFYESKISEICRILKAMPEREVVAEGHFLVADEIERQQDESLGQDDLKSSATKGKQQEYFGNDLVVTARTLQQLFEETSLHDSATGSEILASILARIEDATRSQTSQDDVSWEESVHKYAVSRSGYTATRHCYICSRQNLKPHKIFSSMCIPCGNFNMAGSELSLPPRLSLDGKIAAVTGARVNLGFHVTLRLLRCGARVIASTRYPRDALLRYRAEKDSDQWMDRLRIIGADFRAARDAFELAREIRRVVQEWGGTLHILVNNAAQTLTDSVEKEKLSIKNEEELRQSIGPSLLLPSTSYIPRIRGGNTAAIEGPVTKQVTAGTVQGASVKGSSWVQSLGEIPYEDVISAHSVNAFVPLILMRELLPIMSGDDSADLPADQARGYVVNVSSREGIFETGFHGQRSAKNGVHVHTNMSKAALNMITETEAAAAWKGGRVAINTVDPGYMSAAPEFDAIGEKPIGWEDGAGRVLWPIAVGELHKKGEKGCHTVWGCFLKHYGAARVNLQKGPS